VTKVWNVGMRIPSKYLSADAGAKPSADVPTTLGVDGPVFLTVHEVANLLRKIPTLGEPTRCRTQSSRQKMGQDSDHAVPSKRRVSASESDLAKGPVGRPQDETSDDSYLSLKALARYSGMSVRTLRSRLQSRSAPLPHFRIGVKILVRRSEYDRWARQFRVAIPATAVDRVVDDMLKGLI
jgi:hypothetical protein